MCTKTKITLTYTAMIFKRKNVVVVMQIIALENNMKTPQNFGGYYGVLNIGMTAIVILYIAMGFFGYIKYGPEAAGSVTFNLPKDEA